jgi:hypothetical protein
MAATTYKGYNAQTTGTNTDTWGDKLNTEALAYIDSNLGGIVSKTLSNIQVDLSATESRNAIVRLTGTLTGNVLVTTLAQGFQIVENATSGAFAVTFQLNGVGSAVTIPQGTRALVITDATNGARVGADNQTEFASGFKMFTSSSVAPTGWTAQAGNANRGIRVAASGGGNTGGSADFTDIFTTRGITGSVGGTAISEAQMAAHQHFVINTDSNSSNNAVTASNYIQDQYAAAGSNAYDLSGTSTPATVGLSSSKGGGQTHDHTVTINNLNMNLKYLDVLEIQKN